jgi:myo-inositol-1(or 4)-monophosphatase
VDFQPVLQVARDAARKAVEVHRLHVGQVSTDQWSRKGTADFVTHVDREAERRVLQCIRDAFPDHATLAEEEASDAGRDLAPDDEWLWIIDPLDGTTNFLHRYPMYAVSIAVANRGRLAAGVVYASATDEEWWAVRGAGAFRNGNPITVSNIHRLDQALIGTGFPFKMMDRIDEYVPQFTAVLGASSGIRRAGSAALDLCHLASGWFDGFWELSLAPWDVAAGALIAREAGAIVTRMDGSADILGHGSILAGNPAIHAQLGERLRTASPAGKT